MIKGIIVSLLAFGAILSADPVQVTLVNPGDGLSNGTDYVGPYTLSIGGQNVPAMCMDDFINSNVGDHWSANQTPVTSSDLSNTYLGNSGLTVNGTYYTSSQVYQAEAYLLSELVKPGADRVSLQEAAWAIMDPNTLSSELNSGNTPVISVLYDVQNNFSSFDASNYSIISDVDGPKEQEFMVASPEPASFALLGGGLLAAGVARFSRRRKLAA